jgi:hypothetical protein
MQSNTALLAEKATLLWFATVSDTVLNALRDPDSAAGQELVTYGIDADTLRETSALVKSGSLDELQALRGAFRERFCSPPPCTFRCEQIRRVAETVEEILGDGGSE